MIKLEDIDAPPLFWESSQNSAAPPSFQLEKPRIISTLEIGPRSLLKTDNYFAGTRTKGHRQLCCGHQVTGNDLSRFRSDCSSGAAGDNDKKSEIAQSDLHDDVPLWLNLTHNNCFRVMGE